MNLMDEIGGDDATISNFRKEKEHQPPPLFQPRERFPSRKVHFNNMWLQTKGADAVKTEAASSSGAQEQTPSPASTPPPEAKVLKRNPESKAYKKMEDRMK